MVPACKDKFGQDTTAKWFVKITTFISHRRAHFHTAKKCDGLMSNALVVACNNVWATAFGVDGRWGGRLNLPGNAQKEPVACRPRMSVAASSSMDFGSLPPEILRLILPSHGKAACIAAQVCSSWRTFIQCHLLQTQAAPQSLPNWCRRWQISSLSEANFAFATLSHIRPQILRFADIYGSNGERLSELDMNHLNPTNHINLGLPMDAESFRFFTELSFADDSSCWKNVALMELFFGDDLERMESWWLLVEHRLSTKPFGAPILGSLRFGSSWQNLYHHASLLSSEVVLSLPHFAPQQGAFHRLIFLFAGLFFLPFPQWPVPWPCRPS